MGFLPKFMNPVKMLKGSVNAATHPFQSAQNALKNPLNPMGAFMGQPNPPRQQAMASALMGGPQQQLAGGTGVMPPAGVRGIGKPMPVPGTYDPGVAAFQPAPQGNAWGAPQMGSATLGAPQPMQSMGQATWAGPQPSLGVGRPMQPMQQTPPPMAGGGGAPARFARR